MGNRLCCDAGGINHQMPSSQAQINTLINNFFENNPKLRNVIDTKQPGKIYAPVQRKARLYPNGTYVGKIIDGKRFGFGLMMFDKGLGTNEAMYYEGQWAEDNFEGRGVFIFVDGTFFEGSWKKGLPQGEGLYVNQQQKWRYEGEWSKGAPNGKGKQIFQDSSYYEGDFKNGVRHGTGIFQNHDRSYYKGKFVQGELQGTVKAYNHNYYFEGQFKAGKLEGAGKSQWFKQQKTDFQQSSKNDKRLNKNESDSKQLQVQYIGLYKQGTKNGFGEYRQKNSITFKGNWKDGYIQNKGIFIQESKL